MSDDSSHNDDDSSWVPEDDDRSVIIDDDEQSNHDDHIRNTSTDHAGDNIFCTSNIKLQYERCICIGGYKQAIKSGRCDYIQIEAYQ
jgi:hypothetical protein